MEQLATIKMELNINAQRIISQFQTNNQQFEKTIVKGIEKALTEMLEEKNFVDIICQETKRETMDTIKAIISDWALKYKLREIIVKATENKVIKTAEDWAEKLLKNIKED